MQYTVVGSEDGSSNITVFVPGGKPEVAHSSHPNYDKIVAGVLAGDASVVELFDIAKAAASKFERLTERVTTKNGALYLDGEEVHNELSAQVVRFLSEGVEDWKPLVNFFEKVQTNPNEHSREQLYTWLHDKRFTITDDGNLVGYKGVSVDGDQFRSIFSGKAIVDGEVHEGRIPNYVGAVVEMPRGDVEFNPAIGCHQGLHVGTYEYADGFAQGALLEVHVNPRDVVSVPTHCDAQKMRVCRYQVVDTIDAPHTVAVVRDYGYDPDDQDDFWGDREDDERGSFFDNDGHLNDEPDPLTSEEVEAKIYGPLVSGIPGPVSVGEKFEDLDQRRPRTLTVEAVDADRQQATVKSDKGIVSNVLFSRLLTPYRFKKLV